MSIRPPSPVATILEQLRAEKRSPWLDELRTATEKFRERTRTAPGESEWRTWQLVRDTLERSLGLSEQLRPAIHPGTLETLRDQIKIPSYELDELMRDPSASEYWRKWHEQNERMRLRALEDASKTGPKRLRLLPEPTDERVVTFEPPPHVLPIAPVPTVVVRAAPHPKVGRPRIVDIAIQLFEERCRAGAAKSKLGAESKAIFDELSKRKDLKDAGGLPALGTIRNNIRKFYDD